MKPHLSLALAAFGLLSACGASGPISSACIDADRAAANYALCSCIQRVADQELGRSDQKRAARFFDDPDRAHETRSADDTATEAFWKRYRSFTGKAERSCR